MVRHVAPGTIVVIVATFVTVGPDDAEWGSQATSHDFVDQFRGCAVVARDTTGESVVTGVGTDRVVGDVGAVSVDRLVVVVLDVAGIGVEENVGTIVFIAVGQHGDARRHALVGSIRHASAADCAGNVRRVVVRAGAVMDGEAPLEVDVSRAGCTAIINEHGYAGSIQVVRRGLDVIRTDEGTIAVVHGSESGQRRLDPLHTVFVCQIGDP